MKPKPPKGAETIEMVDGRIYFSTNNWSTVYEKWPSGRTRRLTGKEADLARFLAVAQSSGGPA